MNKTVSSVLAAFFGVSLACINYACVSHDFPTYTPCDESAEVSFQADVKPIVETKCAIEGCHNGSTSLPNWNDFATLQQHAQTGQVKNFVIHRVMPREGSPAGPLTQEQINTIACWIDRGALDN